MFSCQSWLLWCPEPRKHAWSQYISEVVFSNAVERSMEYVDGSEKHLLLAQNKTKQKFWKRGKMQTVSLSGAFSQGLANPLLAGYMALLELIMMMSPLDLTFFFFAFIVCWIYFWVIQFCFCSFFLGDLFVLCHPLFWLRISLFLFSEGHLNVARGAHIWTVPATGSAGATEPWSSGVFSDQQLYVQVLQFSITVSIFKHVQQKFCTLFGLPSLCPNPVVGPRHTDQLHHC